MSYTYSNGGKTLLSVPTGTEHMIVQSFVEVIESSPLIMCTNSLRKVSFLSPSSLTKLQHNTFANCSYLTEVDFSNCTKLTEILSSTFINCKSLTRVVFPDSLQFFDTYVFMNTSLDNFVVPSSLIYIGFSSFENVTTLKRIDFSKAFSLQTFFNFSMRGTSIEILDLRNSPDLKNIDDCALQECFQLKEVYFPCSNSIVQFGEYCFSSCKSLEHVYFSSCKRIIPVSASVFSHCYKLILPYNIHFPEQSTQSKIKTNIKLLTLLFCSVSCLPSH